MRPDEGNWHLSKTIARIVEEQLLVATWQLELRVCMFLAAAFFASLAPAFFMLYQTRLKLDREQRELIEGSSSLPEHEPSARSRARRRHLPTRSASESDFDARKRPNEPSGLLTQSAPESGFDARPGTRQLQRPNETSATSGPFHRQLGMKRDASWHGSPDKCEAGKYAEGSAGTCSDCDAEGPPESTQQMVIKWLESSDRCGFQAVSQALLLRDPVAAHSELP